MHLRIVQISPVDRPPAWNPLEYALDIVRQCSPTISLVAIETNAWKVGLFLYTVALSVIVHLGGKTCVYSGGYSTVKSISYRSREPRYTRTNSRPHVVKMRIRNNSELNAQR
jgi:hypothetical protein